MSSGKYNYNLENFEKALGKFGEALAEPESSIVRDASIQRFEFTYELLWKTLKYFIEEVHGIRTISPRQVFKEAFALSLIDKEDLFIEMIESRNTLAHTYNEDQAIIIYGKCPAYLSMMKNVFNRLKK
ncbi:MAG: nucleotidyltransferase substrate binding protein [Candidatus Marinimicrobia bacterium]|nr:nucleotidyltransferase substrate binding protein [Candidatus Neomarinimicrobiota bacterium]